MTDAAPFATVPFNPIGRWWDDVEERSALAFAIERVLRSGRYVLGEEVEAFEREWAARCGAAHAVGVASGTDALKIALVACEIGPGKRVLTVANSAPATVTAILETGASVCFADVDESGLIDVFTAPKGRIHAVVPVHLYGRLPDMGVVRDFARDRGAIVVEDACQAHGSTVLDSVAGSFGVAAAFSFYPTKNLGCLGDGGAIVTSNRGVADRARRLRNYGLASRSAMGDRAGWNSRLDPLQAAVLRARLPLLDRWNQHRAMLAARYRSAIELPIVSGGNNHIVAVKCSTAKVRNRMRAALGARGVETFVHYEEPAHRWTIWPTSRPESLPMTDAWCDRVLSLPIGNWTTLEEVCRACAAIGYEMLGRRP